MMSDPQQLRNWKILRMAPLVIYTKHPLLKAIFKIRLKNNSYMVTRQKHRSHLWIWYAKIDSLVMENVPSISADKTLDRVRAAG